MRCVKVKYIEILPIQEILIYKINLQDITSFYSLKSPFHIQNSKHSHGFVDQSHVYIYL
jgi:hypothetical protein